MMLLSSPFLAPLLPLKDSRQTQKEICGAPSQVGYWNYYVGEDAICKDGLFTRPPRVRIQYNDQVMPPSPSKGRMETKLQTGGICPSVH